MIRKIIQIDEDKCDGCGLCVTACHEGAIGLIDGKAKLLRDDYCDGLGDCLPACPTGAIFFVEREALAYDEEAVIKNMELKKSQLAPLPCGCPGSLSKEINLSESKNQDKENKTFNVIQGQPSRLSQWPIQIKLVPVNAPYFDGANLLIAADCTAFAYGNFHEEFIKNKKTLIGCPKLDEGDYAEKLAIIIRENNIKSLTVVKMEVPCCSGLERAAKEALQQSGKFIPWSIITISSDGKILDI